MSTKIKTIAIVEDNDRQYTKMVHFLEPLQIEIKRARNKADAMVLVHTLSDQVFWIVDGNFPEI